MEKKFQILSGLNVILFIGLIGIYVLHFMPEKDMNIDPVEAHEELIPEPVEQTESLKQSVESLKVAYINADTLMQRLNIVRTYERQLKYNLQKLQDDLGVKQKELDKKVAQLKKEINANVISVNVAKIRENELMREQQQLMKLSEQYNNRLGVQEVLMNGQLIDTIQNFLKHYSDQKGIDVVFNNVKGNDFFFAKESFDITPEVIRQMNKQYK